MASGWNVWVLLVGVARGRYIHKNYYFSLLHLYYCFFGSHIIIIKSTLNKKIHTY